MQKAVSPSRDSDCVAAPFGAHVSRLGSETMILLKWGLVMGMSVGRVRKFASRLRTLEVKVTQVLE